MAALLIRRRRPIGEPAGDASTLGGPSGAGRIVQVLAELGIDLDGIQQLIVDPEASARDLDALGAVGTFPLVILGSHLINRPEALDRTALLGLARRHLAPGGELLIEHHPIDWAETAADVRPTPGGSQLGMVDVRRDPPFVAAVSVYDVGGRVVRQPFRARVLSDEDLASELGTAGLVVDRRLSPTWLAAIAAKR